MHPVPLRVMGRPTEDIPVEVYLTDFLKAVVEKKKWTPPVLAEHQPQLQAFVDAAGVLYRTLEWTRLSRPDMNRRWRHDAANPGVHRLESGPIYSFTIEALDGKRFKITIVRDVARTISEEFPSATMRTKALRTLITAWLKMPGSQSMHEWPNATVRYVADQLARKISELNRSRLDGDEDFEGDVEEFQLPESE